MKTKAAFIVARSWHGKKKMRSVRTYSPLRCDANALRWRLKKNFFGSLPELRPRAHIHCHHFSLRRKVIQLLSVFLPPRSDSTAVGKRMTYGTGPCARDVRKELPHVDLVLSGLVRHICHPIPARRKMAVALIEFGL